MTPEIKKRIEQIQHGEIPEGYKKTKAGILPVDWEAKNLSDVLKKQTKKNTDGAITNVLTNSATKGIINQTEYFDKQIANDENVAGYYIVHPGYFVYNPRISVTAPCGPFNKYYGETTGIMSPLYTVYKYSEESLYYSEYLSDYFGSAYWHKYMNEIANYGARSDRMNVTSDDMNSLPLPYPPLAEQKKITEILAAQDKVIELKEKLLEEKLKQKKYLMQQLLTGKKRLPGFDGKWEKVKLGSIFSERVETNNASLPLLSVTGNKGVIPRAEIDTKDNSSDDKSKYLKICQGDIGYNTMRMWQGVSALSQYEGIVSPAYTILVPSETISANYFAYLFKTHAVIFMFYRFSQGIVDDTRCLKYPEFAKLSFIVPKGRNEQEAIATILSSADNEILIIQQSIEQEKQKKKALMQLLLTGIVRCN